MVEHGCVYEIEPRHAEGRRLDCNGQGRDNGTEIQIWDSNGQNNQRWRANDCGGYFHFRPMHAEEKALDNPNPGEQCHLWDADQNNDNQKWRVEPAGDGFHYLIKHCSGHVMDISGQDSNNGGKCITWDRNDQPNQQYRFIRV